jgi:hypothetical protein
MTRRLSFILAVLSTVALVACRGDDGDDSPTPDAQQPVADAGSADAAASADAPAAPDAMPVAEICDNGLDDNGDGNFDCQEASCSAVSACTPTAQTIQEVQDGTVRQGANVIVTKVFVTAVRKNASGSVIAFVQTPDGVTSGAHTYPEFAGVQLFASATETVTFPGFIAMVVGDCISFTGSTFEFTEDTEILKFTAFTAETAGTCGTAPTPFAMETIGFGSFATDTDPATMGDQAGALAETYEGVLMKSVNGVTAVAATDMNGQFRVTENGGGAATLEIGKFVFSNNNSPVPATAGQAFTSITGIFAQRTVYQLMPRGMADLQ